MSRLSSLTNLAIEGVRPLGAISLEMGDWLGALSALRTLSLRRSLLGSCPPEVGLLRSLRYLDLSSNMLGALPDQLSGLSGLQVGEWVKTWRKREEGWGWLKLGSRKKVSLG